MMSKIGMSVFMLTISAGLSAADATPLPPKTEAPSATVQTSVPAAGTPSAYFRKITTSRKLPNASSTSATLLSLRLPAGSWIVSAQISAQPNLAGAANYVGCTMATPAVVIDSDSATIGTEKAGVFYQVAALSLQGPLVVAAPATVTLKCHLVYDGSGGSDQASVGRARLTAIPVAGIQ